MDGAVVPAGRPVQDRRQPGRTAVHLRLPAATDRPGPRGTQPGRAMLYHVPEPEHAVGELRRITRPDGRVIVSLNGEDHLRELRDVVAGALVSLGREPTSLLRERISLDQGEALLRSAFASVTRHDFAGQLRVPSPEPVAAYVRRLTDAILVGHSSGGGASPAGSRRSSPGTPAKACPVDRGRGLARCAARGCRVRVVRPRRRPARPAPRSGRGDTPAHHPAGCDRWCPPARRRYGVDVPAMHLYLHE